MGKQGRTKAIIVQRWVKTEEEELKWFEILKEMRNDVRCRCGVDLKEF